MSSFNAVKKVGSNHLSFSFTLSRSFCIVVCAQECLNQLSITLTKHRLQNIRPCNNEHRYVLKKKQTDSNQHPKNGSGFMKTSRLRLVRLTCCAILPHPRGPVVRGPWSEVSEVSSDSLDLRCPKNVLNNWFENLWENFTTSLLASWYVKSSVEMKLNFYGLFSNKKTTEQKRSAIWEISNFIPRP